MKLLATKTYYAPTTIDSSRTHKGNATGYLYALLMTRTFRKLQRSNDTITYDAKRDMKVVKWDEDTDDSKRKAFQVGVKGMEELEWLDANKPLAEIPDVVKRDLTALGKLKI